MHTRTPPRRNGVNLALDFLKDKRRTKEHIKFIFGPDFGGASDTKATLIIRARDRLLSDPSLVDLILNRNGDLHLYKRSDYSRRDAMRMKRISSSTADSPSSDQHTCYQYATTSTFDDKKLCLSNYISATGNNSLSKITCACCGCWTFKFLFHPTLIHHLQIPNRTILTPISPHKSHFLLDGILLHPNGIRGDFVQLCASCYTSLRNNKLPVFALAAGWWPGEIPIEISELSFVERILIAPIIVRAYLIKLYPKHPGSYRLPLNVLNDALGSTVCFVQMPSEKISDMLTGDMAKRLPHPPSVLADVMSVAFVGFGSVPPYYLRGFLDVRRKAVFKALRWLRANNAEYYSVSIDRDAIDSLPAHGVPEEIIIRDNAAPHIISLAYKERRGYTPHKPLDDPLFNDIDTALDSMDVDHPSSSSSTQLPSDLDECLQNDALLGNVFPYNSFEGVELVDMRSVENVPSAQRLLRQFVDQTPEARPLGSNHDFQTSESRECDYGIRVGTQFLSDYEDQTFLRAFPALFPFGIGCPLAQKHVSIKQYFHWAMRYTDGRFRKDKQFLFCLFGIQQKRDVSRSARLTFKRRDWNRICSAMNNVTEADISRAIEEEESKKPISNVALRDFIRSTSFTRAAAVGSNISRYHMRSSIWGTCVVLGNPSLWLTINPVDHHDPIAQYLLGKDIDLDKFDRFSGPSADDRSRFIREDPFIAAEYFNIVVSAILQHLVGVTVDGNRVKSRMGVLGLISSYFGVVEAQGRGNLHVHLLLWMCNTPDAKEMDQLLETDEFRHRLSKYIADVIHAHVPGLSEERCKGPDPRPHPSYNRPPDPLSPAFLQEFLDAERMHVESSQYHKCSDSCLIKVRGKQVCKRHAPFPTASEVAVQQDGNYTVIREIDCINAYNPWIHSVAARCNGDLKAITYGSDTRDLSFYCAGYATKNEEKSYNKSALLGRMKGFVDEGIPPSPYQAHIQDRGQKLMVKLCNAMNSRQEISGAMAVACMEGWAPLYTPHLFTKIFLGDVLRVFRLFLSKGLNPSQSSSFNSCMEDDSNDTVMLEIEDGIVIERSQLNDYAYRGHGYNDKNFIDFIVDTFDRPIDDRERKILLQLENDDPSTRRLYNYRCTYLENHPFHNTHVRISHSSGHRHLPQFVGAAFPSSTHDDELDAYHACMLILFCPWRSWTDVLHWSNNWALSFAQFFENTDDKIRHYIHNTQLQRDSRRTADSKNVDVVNNVPDDIDHDFAGADHCMTDDPNVTGDVLNVSPDGDIYLEPRPWSPKPAAALYAAGASSAGERAGILPCSVGTRTWPTVDNTLPLDAASLAGWISTLKSLDDVTISDSSNANTPPINPVEIQSDVIPNFNADTPSIPTSSSTSSIADNLHDRVNSLNEMQRLTYDIVSHHLQLSMSDNKPPQLLMKCLGSPGTGKSHVIDTISMLFSAKRQALAKGAHQGSAAANIGGLTLCSMCSVKIRQDGVDNDGDMPDDLRPGDVSALIAQFGGIHYLIIDEISQIGCAFFAKISRNLQSAKQDTLQAFGGINTIIFGDFHQVGPVFDQPLYKKNPKGKNMDDILAGQLIYQSFTTAVELTEQVRVTDPVWQSILGRMRYGLCTDDDIEVIRSLTLDDNTSGKGISRLPALNTILLTPRKLVRDAWNSQCVIQFASHHNVKVYMCPAVDTIKGQPLTSVQAAAVQARDPEDRVLPDYVEVAVGMPCMVTLNMHTSRGVANGARGVITGICLNACEPPIESDDSIVFLNHAPSYLLFKPDRPNGLHLPGLEPGVVPIRPWQAFKGFKIFVGNTAPTVTRKQEAILPAFALTIHKCQGQNIRDVVVDVEPPGRVLDHSLYYVAFSRSPGRDHIRILRPMPPNVARKLQTHISQDLRDDDKLLVRQTSSTQARFANGSLFL